MEKDAEILLDLDLVCPKAPAWADGRHNVLSWVDDDDGTVSWCGFGCSWTHNIPAPKKDFWGRPIGD